LPIARGTLLLLKSVRRATPPPAVFFCAAHYHSPTRWRSHVDLGWIGPVALPESATDDETWVTTNLLAAQAIAYERPAPRVMGLTVLAALLGAPYLPLWAIVTWLARRIADDDNVISLWKFLIGTPATLLALIIYTVVFGFVGWPLWLPLASLVGAWLLWNR
jgi:hypothetical protein